MNEAVPEWPPSPFRLLRAMLDAWYRKHSEIAEETVERLLAALSAPPCYSLPPARSSHTRCFLSQNKEDPNDKKLVFDGFAVLDKGSKVLIGWPGLSLDTETIDAARKLFGAFNYFGRSESWVEVSVAEDRNVAWNCVPLSNESVSRNREIVSVAGVVSRAAFDARDYEITVKENGKSRSIRWFEALSWGSFETLRDTMNRPPAMEPLLYVRERDALNARPRIVPRRSTRTVEVVRFTAESRVKVHITDALHVGESVRRNLMGAYRRVTNSEEMTSAFSGKDADGQPLKDHSHVSILPLDEDGDGFIDAVLVTSPKSLWLEELRAFDRVRPIWRRNGHSLVLTPTAFGSREQLMWKTRTVISHTPFAPTQHWRRTRGGELDAWLAAQVSLECERRGLSKPLRVERVPPPDTVRRVSWLDYKRARKDDAPQVVYGLRAEFAGEVCAPFSLGYASHYGLGCFVAEI